MSLSLKIATPERVVFDHEVEKLILPTTEGQITILPHHIPLIAQLEAGEALLVQKNEEQPLAIAGGFVEVWPGNKVVILADTVERAEEIDEVRAEEARKRAQEIMSKEFADEVKFADASAALEKNLARLRVAKRKKHRGEHQYR